MTADYANKHDLDKLARWYKSLYAKEGDRFPVHAMFLVSDRDMAAHNIFRQFRSSFDVRSAQFHHLVIFGQHGVSSAIRELLPKLGLNARSLPVLVMFDESSANRVYVLPLPNGRRRDDDGHWMDLLAKVEEVADKGENILDLASLSGLTGRQIESNSIVGLVGGALQSLT